MRKFLAPFLSLLIALAPVMAHAQAPTQWPRVVKSPVGVGGAAVTSPGLTASGTTLQVSTATGSALTDLQSKTLATSAGTAAAPQIVTVGDLTTGFYRSAAAQIGFSSSGTQSINFAANGINNLQRYFSSDGTAALPALTFLSDQNSGVYSVGADQIGITTGGVLKWTFDANGNIIGSASAKGIYPGAGSAASPTYSFLSDQDTGVYSGGANILAFSTQGNLRFSIAADGSATFAGAVNFASGAVGSPAIAFSTDQDNGLYYIGADDWAASAGGTKVLEFTSTLVSSPVAISATTVKTGPVLVGALPTCNAGADGTYASVTDATNTIITGLGIAVVGGGANHVPVFCDGTSWKGI